MCDTNVLVTKKFLYGGDAMFTVSNNKGEWYTFRVTASKPSERYPNPKPNTFWVKILTGPNNDPDSGNWVYLGFLDGTNFRTTKASQHNEDSLTVKVFKWAVYVLNAEVSIPQGYAISSSGRCAACGRLLTAEPGVNPEGARYGFGPVCWKRLLSKEAKKVI